MDEAELKSRMKLFGLRCLKLIDTLPSSPAGRIIASQLGRAATSVGANYRAACRAKSTADFISKMGTVEEEADESAYWIELLIEDGKVPETKAAPLLKEANELVAITVSSINTARKSGGRP